MEYQEYLKEIFADWRKRCFFNSKVGITLLAFADMVIFAMFLLSGNFEKSGEHWYWYLLQRVIIPVIICTIALIISTHNSNKEKAEEEKNYHALVSLTVITCVISIFNNYFIILLGTPVLSIIASISFGNKVVMKRNLKWIAAGLAISFFTFAIDKMNRGNVQYAFMTILVVCIFYVCIAIFAFSLADIHKRNLQMAFEGLIHRDELLNRLHRDNLTGLYNKNYLSEYIPQIKRDKDVYIALLDLDNFKTVNDQEGHLAGDDVLRDVGMILECVGRESAKIFRFGGDEFVVVGECAIDEFNSIIKCAMNDLKEKLSSSIKNIQITTSVGATKLLAEDSIDTVIERADKLMYRAKQNGKNCCVSDL